MQDSPEVLKIKKEGFAMDAVFGIIATVIGIVIISSVLTTYAANLTGLPGTILGFVTAIMALAALYQVFYGSK